MKPRIAIPVPTSFDLEYNERSWPQYARAVERSGGEPVAIPLDQPPAETARLAASCSAILLPGSGADVNPQKYGQEIDPRSAPPDPARENVDELLLQDAHNMGKPILTICFGTQMLNVWRGGSLIQDIDQTRVSHTAGRSVVQAHATSIPSNSLLGRIVAEAGSTAIVPDQGKESAPADAPSSTPPTLLVNVNSSHHQAVATPGDGLRISARSPEDNVVEAIEGIPILSHKPPAPPEDQVSNGHGSASPPDNSHPAPGAPAWNRFILGVQWHPERTFDESALSRALFASLIAEARIWSPRTSNAAPAATPNANHSNELTVLVPAWNSPPL